MRNTPRICAIATLLSFSALPAPAAITPGAPFTDNAVLQQKAPVPIWGNASPSEPITVTFAGQTATTTANSSGHWAVTLKPLVAGGPYTLAINGASGDAVALKNVLVGEVWICSGQSNMYYPLVGFPNNPLTRAAIPLSTDPQLHIAIAPLAVGDTPQTTLRLTWQEANSTTVPQVSAVGYFFARDLRKALGVPVGLIEAAVGGSPAQAWTSKETLQNNPALLHHLVELDEYVAKYPTLVQQYNIAKAAYDAAMTKWQADADAAKAAGTEPPKRPQYVSPPMEPDKWFRAPARLYNGMIAPLIPYAIRGVIWYQGEQNWDQGYDYKTLFPAMIADWRQHWGEGDFPFLYVQLPGNGDIVATPGGSWLAEVREAQRLTLAASPNTAMVVIDDQADQKNIHPNRKEPVGKRLAIAARGLAYGEKIEYSGPMLSSVSFTGATASVTFSHADGLHTEAMRDVSDDGPIVAPAGTVKGFALAGADQKFYNADARIDGASVILTSPDVPVPVAVRYGWAQFPLTNLVNSAGLWAAPFKTDDWRWISNRMGTGR